MHPPSPIHKVFTAGEGGWGSFPPIPHIPPPIHKVFTAGEGGCGTSGERGIKTHRWGGREAGGGCAAHAEGGAPPFASPRSGALLGIDSVEGHIDSVEEHSNKKLRARRGDAARGRMRRK